MSNSVAHSESKSARKKKAKAEAPIQTVASPIEPESGAGQTAVDGAAVGTDGSEESPYIKELYKYASCFNPSNITEIANTISFRNIRNIKKKLVRRTLCKLLAKYLMME